MQRLRSLVLVLCVFLFFQTAYADLSTGSGFFITADGYFVTNAHVIEGSDEITLLTNDGKELPAYVVRVDKANDIAIIKVEGKFIPLWIGNSRSVKRGQRVVTIGYPHVDVQGLEPKVTDGIVNSLSGLRDDPRVMQISVPVQSGNSGGPLVNEDGIVIGIVAAKLSAMAMLKQTGDLPQNVNYALKSNYLLEALSSVSGLEAKLAPLPQKKPRDTAELASMVEKSVSLVLAKVRLDDFSTIESRPERPVVPVPKPQKPSPPVLPHTRPVPEIPSPNEWVRYYEMAAEKGDTEAQMKLGWLYEKGKGVARDIAKAMNWYGKAAVAGEPAAQYNLGLLQLNDAKTVPSGLNWLNKAAEQNLPDAQAFIAGLYQDGKHVQKDDAMAVKWLTRAAELGHAPSQNNLGLRFAEGRGVKADPAKALAWLTKAAEQNNIQAQFNLAQMLEQGQGGAANLHDAMGWYRAAAFRGHQQAIAALVRIEESGTHLVPNKTENVNPDGPQLAQPASLAADPLAEPKAYEAALNHFKTANYPASIAGFKNFLKTYPGSNMVSNAQYWIGYSYYALKDYKTALAQQQKMVSSYPQSNKIPDALLNISSCLVELDDMEAAKKTLAEIVSKHPGTNAAKIAAQRLNSLM